MHTSAIKYLLCGAINMTNLIAVETSDLVGSTTMSSNQLTLAMNALKECLSNIQTQHASIIEFYRGDAFQIMYPNAVFSLRASLLVKLYMLWKLDFPVNITQSLALGYITKPVITLHDRMDDVFVKSGRQLASVGNAELGIFIASFDHASYLSLAFLNRILHGLSAKQALVLYWYIKNDFPEHKKIAMLLNMSRQNVNTHLLRGNADLIKRFIYYFEHTVEDLSL
ncbi:MAG: hypothetical protein ACJA0G_000164 [Kangiellaceae bacterium]